jgi:hypothetical protein
VRGSTRRLRATDHDYDLAVVERAPLPPHERPWRHPSELAADARQAITDERPSGSTRTAALLGGSATILLFGVAILSLTPTTADGPTVSGSTPIQRLASSALTVPSTTPPAPGQVSGQTSSQVTALGPAPTGPLAAEVGAGGLAVLPSRTVIGMLQHERSNGDIRSGPRIDMVGRSDASSWSAGIIVVTLHSGVTTLASVIDVGDGAGLAVVRVAGDPDDVAPGFRIAANAPEHDDMVTVLSDEPITMPWQETADMDHASVADGTAVVDSEGDLVGVYTEHGDDGRIILIDDAVSGATTRD